MMWWIILAILVVATIVFFILDHNIDLWTEWPFACAVISLILSLAVLIVCVTGSIAPTAKIDRFERTKAYVESHVSSSLLEDVSITTKKIELNQWLFGAQANKATFGAWSFYPESVLDLEPIE